MVNQRERERESVCVCGERERERERERLCVYMYVCVCVCARACSIAQSCPILCDAMALLSMEFSRQEYWRGLPFPSPGDLLDPEMESASPAFFSTDSQMWQKKEES